MKLRAALFAAGFFLAASSWAADVYFSPRHDVREQIIKRIDGAKTSIDIAVFAFTSDSITRALSAARKRGVAIRVIRDKKPLSEELDKTPALKKARIEVAVFPSVGMMHHKFAVFDKKALVTGSYNWTESAERHNFENTLFIDDVEIVNAYRDEFEKMWQICVERGANK